MTNSEFDEKHDAVRRSRTILQKIRGTIERYHLLKKGDRVLIAFSGGADSTALLAAFLELQREYSLELAIAHFNHGLRRSAARDAKSAGETAKRHRIPFDSGREDIRTYARKRGLNLEEAGRRRRYEFLRTTAAKIGATKIATGHTMNDQAETVLLRLLRGTGPLGLSGIAPIVDGLIIRPLLEIERSEVNSFLRAKRLSCCQDESNQDLRFLRNRIRLRLIPYLQKNFEPRIVRHLARLAQIVGEDEEFLAGFARPRIGTAMILSKDKVDLDVAVLTKLPAALARRCIRDFLGQVKGDLRRISFEDVEAVRSLAEGRALHLPGGLVLERRRGRIFQKDTVPLPVLRERLWDGRTALEIKEIGLRFAGRSIVKKKGLALSFDDEERVYLDTARITFPLVVRGRREGDRYRPLGAPGRQKLKEIMRAKGIPLNERNRRPVFLSGGQIVWVAGLPVADAFKVTPKTRIILAVEKT
jgi:tRNA(Ile)-lysidine synthase